MLACRRAEAVSSASACGLPVCGFGGKSLEGHRIVSRLSSMGSAEELARWSWRQRRGRRTS